MTDKPTESAREFWLASRNDGQLEAFELPCDDYSGFWKAVKVIEKSAYHKVVVELTAALRERDEAEKREWAAKELNVVANAAWVKERDDLKKQCEELRLENERLRVQRGTDELWMTLINDNASLRITADDHIRILKKVLSHLDNPATTPGEALCLIRRDVENAIETKNTSA